MSADGEAIGLVNRMVEALNEHVIDGQEEFWSQDMVWRGPEGIGTKTGLRAFQDEHQRPFLHAFPDKQAHDEVRFGCGKWAASTGYQQATHLGDWLGIPASGLPVKVRYMDIWRSEDGRLVENWVLLDLVDFCRQIGVDVLQLVRDEIAARQGDGPEGDGPEGDQAAQS